MKKIERINSSLTSNKSQFVDPTHKSVDDVVVVTFKIVQLFNSFMNAVWHFLNVMFLKRGWSLWNVRRKSKGWSQYKGLYHDVISIQKIAKSFRFVFLREKSGWGVESYSLLLDPCPSTFSDKDIDGEFVKDGRDNFIKIILRIEIFLDEPCPSFVQFRIEIINCKWSSLE